MSKRLSEQIRKFEPHHSYRKTLAKWADDAAQLEAQVRELEGRILHDGVMRMSILGVDEAEHGAECEWQDLSEEDKQWWMERRALLESESEG